MHRWMMLSLTLRKVRKARSISAFFGAGAAKPIAQENQNAATNALQTRAAPHRKKRSWCAMRRGTQRALRTS